MSVPSSASRFRVQRQPNFENLRRTVLRQGPPGPVPFVELFADPGMVEAVLGEKFGADLHRYIEEPLVDVSADELRGLLKAVEMYIRFCYEMGYDYVFMVTGLHFRRSQMAVADTAAVPNWAGGLRYWQDESSGPIQSWEDFEAYPWPRAEEVSYAAFEYLNAVLPDGMKISVFQFGGVFENATWLMGLQPFSYALRDQPELVEAICQRVGELTTAVAAHVVTIDNVGMLFLGDDLGFYSGTLVSPDVLRRYIVPHYKKMAEVAHRAGKLFLFHSCGNVYKLMDDFIDDVGIDAKHSFEDKILPVEEAYRRWGDRIAILGGLDMDLLGRGTEEQVRARTRQILEACGARGTGYGLGTGNTAANYVPVQNYLAMLDEGRRWNREHFGAA
ncbi:MAG: uroporphyrinogen decarboxylase family protein [Chloroflexota bacterium]|nr:uroporphyrinogen decarboxylase family protein [Chloroflexota bacterium]